MRPQNTFDYPLINKSLIASQIGEEGLEQIRKNLAGLEMLSPGKGLEDIGSVAPEGRNMNTQEGGEEEFEVVRPGKVTIGDLISEPVKNKRSKRTNKRNKKPTPKSASKQGPSTPSTSSLKKRIPRVGGGLPPPPQSGEGESLTMMEKFHKSLLEQDPLHGYMSSEGSGSTLSKSRKNKKKKSSSKWSQEETTKFYDTIQNLGLDFSLIGMFFPDRTRKQLLNKYRKEKKINPLKVDASFGSGLQNNSSSLQKRKQMWDMLEKQNQVPENPFEDPSQNRTSNQIQNVVKNAQETLEQAEEEDEDLRPLQFYLTKMEDEFIAKKNEEFKSQSSQNSPIFEKLEEGHPFEKSTDFELQGVGDALKTDIDQEISEFIVTKSGEGDKTQDENLLKNEENGSEEKVKKEEDLDALVPSKPKDSPEKASEGINTQSRSLLIPKIDQNSNPKIPKKISLLRKISPPSNPPNP